MSKTETATSPPREGEPVETGGRRIRVSTENRSNLEKNILPSAPAGFRTRNLRDPESGAVPTVITTPL